jgi:glycosyltransferase involved in cell wall biosynthesis
MGGGAEVHLHEILRRLVQWGHEVTWLACHYPGAAYDEVSEDGIHYLRRGRWELANLHLPRLLREELGRNDYDVVLEDINKIPFYSPLHTKLPVLAVVPHLFGGTVFRETNPIFATYVWASELPIRWIYRGCRFMAISQSTKVDLERRGIRGELIDVAECGMDHSLYQLETPPPRSPHPQIVHLGRLRRYKSVDVVVRALVRIREVFPEAELQIVGDGPDRVRLQTLAFQLGLSNAVHFRGFLPRKEVVELLHRTQLFLNPSPKEGWGLTVIEANECGVPVVASRRPGLTDSVRDGETGLLAEYGDVDDFAAKALSLLTDPPQWRAMSENAVRWAQSFDWDETARGAEESLKKCLR